MKSPSIETPQMNHRGLVFGAAIGAAFWALILLGVFL